MSHQIKTAAELNLDIESSFVLAASHGGGDDKRLLARCNFASMTMRYVVEEHDKPVLNTTELADAINAYNAL